jgi:hypothetical protein
VIHENDEDRAYFVMEYNDEYYVVGMDENCFDFSIRAPIIHRQSGSYARINVKRLCMLYGIINEYVPVDQDVAIEMPALINGHYIEKFRVEFNTGDQYVELSYEDGQIPYDMGPIVIGFPYQMTVKTVDPEISSEGTAIVGDMRSVCSAVVSVRNTRDLKVGWDEKHLEALKFPYPKRWDDPPRPYSGELQIPLAGHHRTSAEMVMRSELPYPCTILSLMTKISIG